MKMKTTAVKGKPGIRIKENGKFLVFKHVAGQRFTREFTTLREAEAWKKDKSFYDLSVNGKNPTLSGQGEGRNEIYFRDMAEQYFKEGMIGLSEYTVYKKKQRMAKFLPNLYPVKLSEMSGRVILKHLDEMKLLISKDSKRCNFDKELKDLASIFAWYNNEIADVPNPVKRKQFDHGVIRNIRKKKKDVPADAVPFIASFMKEPFRSLATVQFLLGIRIGEAVALNTSTVNFKKREIEISETIVWIKGKPKHEYTTKTGKAAPPKKMTPKVEEILLRLNAIRPRGCQFFFNHKGKMLRYGMILKHFNEALEASGYGGYSGTHILRHSSGTFTRREAGLDVAQSQLSHSSARQTEVYARLDVNEKVTGVVLKMEKLFEETQPSRNHESEKAI
jgi:integrase